MHGICSVLVFFFYLILFVTSSIISSDTFVGLYLIDKVGRKTLLLIGSFGYIISLAMVAWCFYPPVNTSLLIVFLAMFIASHAVGQGAVIWVFISEIFPNRVRGMAISVAVSSLWISCFLATFTFPLLIRALGAAGTFWIYGAICLVGSALIKMRVSETKGKTLEEIERDLAVRRPGG